MVHCLISFHQRLLDHVTRIELSLELGADPQTGQQMQVLAIILQRPLAGFSLGSHNSLLSEEA
jgi:hypothetical protein